MEKANDSPAFLRKQDLSVLLVGTLLLVASVLDPDGTRIPLRLQGGLVALGVLCVGWAVWNAFTRAKRTRGEIGEEFFTEGFFEKHKKALLVLLFAVHLMATLFFFSPADIVNERPVVTLDHAFHYYQARRANEVFFETARLHAYDPHFMAGFPSALFDLDVKALEAFCAPFPDGQVGRAMKFFILGCYLSMVFTVYIGCRCLRLTEREAILSVAVLLVYWHWGRPYASHFRYAGMFDFICVSHFSILAAGLFRRFLWGKGAIWWLILGPVAYFIHPTAVVILAVPYVCLIFFAHREITLKKTLLFVLWCAVVVLINSIWIIPLLEYAYAKTGTKAFFQTAGAADLAHILFRPGCLPAIALIALAVPGAWRLGTGGRRPEAVTLSCTFVFLLFVTAFGVFLPGVKHLEPGRFFLTALFFSAPLAGAGVASLFDACGRYAKRAPWLRVVGGVGFLILVLSPIVLSCLSARTGYRHRVSTTIPSKVQELVEAVQQHTNRAGRLMIEDGPAALYGDVHLPGLLPLYTGVEQIGGPYPFTFLEHHFATFQQDWTMGKPLAEISAREFWAYADLYNIRWVLAASAGVKDFVVRLATDTTSTPRGWLIGGAPPVSKVWESDRYVLWRVNRPPTFTGGEADRVSASFDRIEIDLAGDRREFLLRYHWDKGLKVRPPATITPIRLLEDPVPFMLVEPNGATSILIEY
jgi:hypothetical protein